ncbi:MAG TPA: quinone-dependent dihydroorotate dehydrogenase [Candidatus Thiothrix moscowensis]|uniref:quinone-dependent dihydroorotate dehydrogenase n=1 Tax=unclassified Thiothrix TaxID=2636184 RepID=UPI0025D0B81B|nr:MULTISPECIES: quinone-dependent dihydroorotate dehydrogenase [unclassified Thiothrix]HRJ53581.1 quinone-dependent dihydroorotate dehydrogenase [Candidatus Thiothrix moscowensis]HRJ93611.1 quinone-dependent dihydroorotate dehydrogenase [Candidatus Thiothrix moscowensis]
MYKLLRDALFLFPAETSHHLALNSLKLAGLLGALGKSQALPGKTVRVMGIDFPNPVGLAAGLDKNGEYIDALAALGFGFIEIGTVTPRPQPGNPKPRLFRLPEAQGIINRMGFNNQGIDYLLENVRKASYQGIIGINIGKNFDTAVENAADDYLIGLRKAYSHAHYITVNISSPNTPGLRKLQYGDDLKRLLEILREEQGKLVQQHGRYVPVAIKVAPDLTEAEIRDMAGVFSTVQIDALIATNTTLDKSAVQGLLHADEQGGLSGKPLTQRATEVIRQFRADMDSQIPIIGVGGILSGQDAQAKLDAGASLVQVYSGFIYRGPELVRECVEATKKAG